jgi:predicted short-subunit dehydrogenase-like oxidoreductase (DUF2520 family)
MVSFNISFIGAGRVADALCRIMHGNGHRILQICSTAGGRGGEFAKRYSARFSGEPVFPKETEILIVAVPDHKLIEVVSRIKCSEHCIVAHTAGSYGVDIFPENIRKPGVFYPLQTFSHNRTTDLKGVPVFIETTEIESAEKLGILASSIGCNVYYSDLEHRKLLHVAAVFVSNFVNYMLTSGKMIASEAGFSFEVLRPLILETVNKAVELSPEESQTGPAVRYDLNTIEKHKELLSFSSDLQKIYDELTTAIINYYKLNRGNGQL